MRRKDFDRDEFLSKTWPEALESGEFKQTKGTLHNEDTGGYCCLGVACELLSRLRLLPRKNWQDEAELTEEASDLLGITDSGDFNLAKQALINCDSLVRLNDSGKSFKTIAKRIRTINKGNRWVRYV